VSSELQHEIYDKNGEQMIRRTVSCIILKVE
jgi:hypothetical protein